AINCRIYKYSLTSLNAVQRVQFSRAIEQVLGSEGQFLTRSVVLIPLVMKNRMMECLKAWKVYSNGS
ncbi:MAG: hypothetical protein AABY26_01330, partial [Nanoarchaeota archaeon]